jgi:hypothetical protein
MSGGQVLAREAGLKSLLLSAPIKTGNELGMKGSCDEGLANHTYGSHP